MIRLERGTIGFCLRERRLPFNSSRDRFRSCHYKSISREKSLHEYDKYVSLLGLASPVLRNKIDQTLEVRSDREEEANRLSHVATSDLCQRMLRLFENTSPEVIARNSFGSTANGRMRLNDAVNSSPNKNSDANISARIIFHSTEFSFRIISVIIISFGRLFLAKVCSLRDRGAKGVRRDRNCIISDCVSLARTPLRVTMTLRRERQNV